MEKINSYLKKYLPHLVLVALLAYAGFLITTNITNYPYYESDEGTYTMQAWSVFNEGKLAPYTYWYDHPPVGWLTLAAWYSILPDQYFTFGTSIDTGRMLMALLFVVNAFFVFRITHRITRSLGAATLAAVLFISSPLTLHFARRILLDNIQTFWVLASIYVLLPEELTLRRYALSGLLFGLAFLTKITAIFMLPAMIFLVVTHKSATHLFFRLGAWLSTSGIVVAFYLLYALLKGELLPPIFGQEHVSLWQTLLFQLGRGSDRPFYQVGSDFMNAASEWWLRDPLLCLIGLASIIFGLLTFYFVKNFWYRFFVILTASFAFFLIRGGLVINFYFLPLVPHISILTGLIVYTAKYNLQYLKVLDLKWSISKYVPMSLLSVPLIALLLWHYNTNIERPFLTVNETDNQKKSVIWIKKNLPDNSNIIIDATAYVELHDAGYVNDKVFDNAEWFYKVSRDPAIRDTKFNNDWQSFDYLALSHEMLIQLDKFDENDIVRQAFDNGTPIAKWFEGSSAFIDEQKRRSTNGDWAMVYDTNSATGVELETAWEYYKKNYIVSYGQVIDPAGDITTSEGQSYAMLRAVWMNDHDTFKGVWAWTQHHLQHRLDDKLISWKWQDEKLIDSENASDADVDIALALLFGSKMFGEEQYKKEAEIIIADIWRQSVIEINGRYVMISSNKKGGQVPTGLLFNPSYLSPAHYRIFAEVDKSHNWNKLADDSYETIELLTKSYQTPLVKNWYVIDPKTGAFSDASPYVGDSANQFSYDAFRIFWRVWLDYAWFNNQDAEAYLTKVGNHLAPEAKRTALPSVIDPVSGNVLIRDNSLAVVSSYGLPLRLLEDKKVAENYMQRVVREEFSTDGYWSESDNYYTQNWAWFNSALYYNDVYNVWNYE